MGKVKNTCKLIMYNIKILFGANYFVALGLLLVIFSAFNLKYLPYGEVANIGEHFFAFWGIILLTYVIAVEQNYNISESIYLQKISFWKIYLLRLLINTVIIFGLIFVVLMVAKFQQCDFVFLEMLIGTWMTAMYLGIIGVTVNTISGQHILGYLVAITYYFIELYYEGKILEKLYIFSLTQNSFDQKYILLLISVFLILINLRWIYIKR